MSFLPNNYEVPKKEGNYMKFEDGENRFRVLASPIIGYLWWEDDGDKRKPIRVRMGDAVPVSKAEETKHFWAMPVWNYKAKRVQILELTQKTIQRYIKNLVSNPKWGSPMEYDLVVTKTGQKLETEYDVMADPKEKLEPDAQDRWENSSINLEALYDGEDPFAEIDDSERIANDVNNSIK